MFKHLIHDGYSFYGITDTGALLWYRDLNNNGTVGWAPASGKQIGVGWGKFIRIFPGSDPGEIYAVEPSGNLLWYRDLARDGSNGAGGNSGWDHSSGQTIGEGWNAVLHVFPGPNGVIYAVKPTGELLWFKDLKQTAPRWANKGVGKQIGVGWNNAAKIVSSRHAAPPQSFNDYVIYFVKPNGDLLWYHDDRADGSNDPKGMSGWAHASGSRIGVGWDVATMLMGAAAGVLYISKPGGQLFWYQDILRDGASLPTGYGWAPNSGKQAIGSAGWIPTPASLPASIPIDLNSITFSDDTPVGGNAHVLLKPDGSFSFWCHFRDAGDAPFLNDYDLTFTILVKDANNNGYALSANGSISHSGGTYDWNTSGNNSEIAKNWAALAGSRTIYWHIRVDTNWAALFNALIEAAGDLAKIITLDGPAPDDPPGDGDPNAGGSQGSGEEGGDGGDGGDGGGGE